MKTSPSQIRTCIVRISKVARAVLQENVNKNNSSIADEVDKVLMWEISEYKERKELNETKGEDCG